MKLYLVRHGETEWNRRGLMQGRHGVGLNETGREQVEELRREIETRGLKFDVCYVSPLQRAVETAEILVRGREIEKVLDERLIERGFGEFEGKTSLEYHVGTKEKDTLDLRLNYGENGVEPIKEVFRRAESFLSDLEKIVQRARGC